MAIKEIQLPTGEKIVIDEWLHWATYSTMEFSSAVRLDLRCFTYLVGQTVAHQGAVAARTATTTDTNQIIKGQTNFDEALLIYAITYEPWALTDAEAGSPAIVLAAAPAPFSTDIRKLQRHTLMEFNVGAKIRKPQISSPMSFVGQSVGSPAFSPGDAAAFAANTTLSYGTAGQPTGLNQRLQKLPIYVESSRTMFLKLSSPTALDLETDFRIRWYLDGLRRRPVA